MSYFAFPSLKDPLYYFSNKRNVIHYFATHFLFSKKSKLQLFINIIKFVLPDSIIFLLIEMILNKENQIPSTFSETFVSIKEYIVNNNIFSSHSCKQEDIGFIIRKTNWQRTNDKFVILLFGKNSKNPFAVAKVGSLKFKDTIELEFHNTMAVYDKFKDSNFFIVPEPVTFYISAGKAVYLEKVIDGVSFNNYLKHSFFNLKKKELYFEIIGQCSELLRRLKSDGQLLTAQDFNKYFYDPIDNFQKTALGIKYSSKLNKLKEQTGMMHNKLYSVWMHGDLWGGSVLYNGNKPGFIDWEFLSRDGVPLWDFFTIAFHVGTGINITSSSDISDFLIYFNNTEIANKIDTILIELGNYFLINISFIPFLFQCYLLFNIQNKDTDRENYWQQCLEYYWNLHHPEHKRIL